MTLREKIDLESAYIIEPVLSVKRVEFYYSMGKQNLLEKIRKARKHPICVNLCAYGGEIIPEIIDGCHRAKALYRHSIKTVKAEIENDGIGQGLRLLRLDEGSVKLIEAPELNEIEYSQFLEKFRRLRYNSNELII